METKNLLKSLKSRLGGMLCLLALLTFAQGAWADTWYAHGSWNNWQISDTYKFTENSSTDFTAVFTLNGSGNSYEFVITNSNRSTDVKCTNSNVWMSRDGNYYTNNMSTEGSNDLHIWLQKNSTIRLKWNGSNQLYVCINEPQCIAGNQCFDGLGDWSPTTKNLNNVVTRLKGTSIRFNTFKRNGTTPEFKITDGNGWKNGDGIEFKPDEGTITVNATPVELHQQGSDYDNLKLNSSSQDWYYSFMVLNYNVSKISVLETKESPVTISSVNHGAVNVGSDVSITASLSASVTTSGNGAQYAYIYCTTSEVLYPMTISGTTATGSIPASVNTAGTTVNYYVITSPLNNLEYDAEGFDYLYLNSSEESSYTVPSDCTPPSITSQPSTEDKTYTQGETATALSVTATGTAPLSYQWKKSSTSGGTYEEISGATSNSYTPSTATIGTTYYKCYVSNSYGNVTSEASGAITVTKATYYAVGEAIDGTITYDTFHEMTDMGDGTYRIEVEKYDDKKFKITTQPCWNQACPQSEDFYNDNTLSEGPNAYIYCWLSDRWTGSTRDFSYIKDCQPEYGAPVYLYINPTTKKIWAEATSKAITIEDLYIRGPLVDGKWPDADKPSSYHQFTKDGDTFTIKLYGSGGGGGEAGKFVLTTGVGENYRIPWRSFNLEGCHGDTDTEHGDAQYNFITDLSYDEEEGYVLTVSITLVEGKYSLVVDQKALPFINDVTDGSRCGEGTVTLSATATAGEGTVSIKWYAAAKGGEAIGEPTESGATWTTPSISENTTYYAEAVDDNFASKERRAVTATVIPLPKAGTINAGDPVCKGSTVTLTVENQSSASVQWQNSSKDDIPGATKTSYTIPALQESTDYYVKFTKDGCSSTSEKGTATVKDASLSIKASTATVNPYTVVTLTAKDNNNADKASDWTITGTGSYLVNATSKEVYTSNPTGVSSVVMKPAKDVETTVTATATVDDCEATGTYTVTPTDDSEDCN